VAKKKAGVGADETIERMVLPKPKSFFEQMLGGPDADAEVQVQVAKRLQAALPPGFGELLGDATQLLQLFKEPAVTVLPYQIRIK